jgi:hypothetical protein
MPATHQFNNAGNSPFIQYWQQLTTNSVMTATHHASASTTFFLPPSILHLCKLARFLQFKNCSTQLVTVPWVCDRGKHLLSLLGQSATKTEWQSCLPLKHLLCISATTAASAVSMCLLHNLQIVTMFRILTFNNHSLSNNWFNLPRQVLMNWNEPHGW